MPVIVGLIPARGGSKGIPGKNLKPLGGKPLLQWTIDSCASMKRWYQMEVVVSTEDVEIANSARHFGARVLCRPIELAADDTPMRAVLEHAVQAMKLSNDDAVLLLQPTCPFRTDKQMRDAYWSIRDDKCDSVISVREIPYKYSPEWAMERTAKGMLKWVVPSDFRPTRRQDLEPAYYRDGEIYAFKAGLVDKFPMCGRVLMQDIADHPPCNLDTLEDWKAAERLLEDRESFVRLTDELCAPAGGA